MTVYEMLAELAERELELVTGGAFEQLPELHLRRDAIVAALPPRPPAEARTALERAAVTQERVTVALEARRHGIAAELGRLGEGRRAVHGYTPPLAPRRRLDASC